jgi:deoxyribose-phosphate aldolase
MTDVDLLTQKARKQAALAEAGLLKKPPLQTLRSFVDHTLLLPGYSEKDIHALCEEAATFGFASVCIPSLAVPLAREHLAHTNIRIGAMVSLPLGTSPISTKLDEITFALEHGAQEIHVMPHLSNIRNGQKEKLQEELLMLRRETRGRHLHIVLETSLLSHEEIICITRLVSHAEADYIASGTGFFGRIRPIDVALIYVASSSALKIKASGEINSSEQIRTFCALGASRIGTSWGASIFSPAACGQCEHTPKALPKIRDPWLSKTI